MFTDLVNDNIHEICKYLSASDKNTFRCCNKRISNIIKFDPKWKVEFFSSPEFINVWNNLNSDTHNPNRWIQKNRTWTRYGQAYNEHKTRLSHKIYLNEILVFEFSEKPNQGFSLDSKYQCIDKNGYIVEYKLSYKTKLSWDYMITKLIYNGEIFYVNNSNTSSVKIYTCS